MKGIHGFQESGIQELDELHKVIENLTDTQMQTENQLLEEKERYRIAVESSQDAFFTYKCKEKLLEIVNSKGNDGVWDCGKHPEFLDNDSIHPADKAKLVNAVKSSDGVLDVDFRLQHANGEFQWVIYPEALLLMRIKSAAGSLAVFTMCISTSFWSRRRKESRFMTPLPLFTALEADWKLWKHCVGMTRKGYWYFWKSSSFPKSMSAMA